MAEPAYVIPALLSLVRRAASVSTLARLHSPIEHEIRAAGRRIGRAERSGDTQGVEATVDDECEQTEELLGLGFVAAQTFITAVRNRVVSVYESGARPRPKFCSDDKGFGLLKIGDPQRKGASYTPVEAINAVANYWKHQDDWRTREERLGRRLVPVWDPRKNEKRAIEIVTDLGMAPSSTGNLRNAAKKLGVQEFEDLAPVREALRLWAETVYADVRADIAP